MNTLNLVKVDGEVYADSRDVAEFLERPHGSLLKTIRNYSYYLMSENVAVEDYFEEGEYPDSTGKKRPCKLITEEGCRLIASKTDGAKGILFAIACKNAFEQYGRFNKKQIPAETSAREKQKELNEITKQLQRLEKLIDCITPVGNGQ